MFRILFRRREGIFSRLNRLRANGRACPHDVPRCFCRSFPWSQIFPAGVCSPQLQVWGEHWEASRSRARKRRTILPAASSGSRTFSIRMARKEINAAISAAILSPHRVVESFPAASMRMVGACCSSQSNDSGRQSGVKRHLDSRPSPYSVSQIPIIFRDREPSVSHVFGGAGSGHGIRLLRLREIFVHLLLLINRQFAVRRHFTDYSLAGMGSPMCSIMRASMM
jgi:hypothetical protein